MKVRANERTTSCNNRRHSKSLRVRGRKNVHAQQKRSFCRPLHGFTLVELLVVITIIGILISLLLPAVQAAREAARRVQCQNNMKQVALALHSYHEAHDILPYASSWPDMRGGTWAAFILPHCEQQNVYDLFHFNLHIYDAANTAAVTTVVSTYICPADSLSSTPILPNRRSPNVYNPASCLGLWYVGSMGPTDQSGAVGQYITCVGCSNQTPSPNNYCCQGFHFGTTDMNTGQHANTSVGMFGRYPRGFTFAQVRDGLSNTIMIGETLPGDSVYNGAYCPNFPLGQTSTVLNMADSSDEGDPAIHPTSSGTWTNIAICSGFKSRHPGGANFAFGDGSIHFLPTTIDYRLYNNLGTRSGGEVIVLPN